MFPRALQLPARRSVLLLGPRQTGKSTLIRAHLPQGSLTIDLLHHDEFLRYSKEPSLLRRVAIEHARRGAKVVFINEVQRVPALLDEVHGLIEQHGLRFLLTGSSAHKLRRGGTNLLAGRADRLHMHPLSADEIGDRFDLERALRLGTLPPVAAGSDEDAIALLRSYAQTYLREEVQAEAAVRNLGGFARFLDVAAAQSGELLNAAAVGRDAAVAARTVRDHYQLLEDTMLGFRLEAWRSSVRRRLVGHARFYLFDTGVQNAINHRLGATIDPVMRGRLFEQWIVLELRRRIDLARSEARLFFWRTNHGGEVDLLVERHGRLRAAIEIKSGRSVSGADLRGLRSFSDEHPSIPCFVVVPEARRHTLEKVTVLDWKSLLAESDAWL